MPLRIAYVTPWLPAPADSGSVIRAARLARAVARLGPVTLYCRASDGAAVRPAEHEELRPFARVRVQAYPREEYAKLSRVFTAESIAHWTATDDPLAARLAEDHRQEPFDVVVCQQVLTANVARGVPDVPVVLDEHNIESDALRQVLADVGRYRDVRGPRPEELAATVAAYEQAAWSRAALVTCPTEADARWIEARRGRPVQVIPNGADVGELAFTAPSRRGGKEVLFVGAFFWAPNARAARFLARDVLPRVRSAEPEARLTLCGKSPGVDVALLRRPRVEVTGTVPSVVPFLQRAAVYANALFAGTGSSLKCLEALAAGIPLISTAVGVRGFPLVPGRHYLAAETTDEFARAILDVIADPSRFDEMARAGRAVAEQFAWEHVGEEFAAAVAGVAGGQGGPSPG